jgi:hypothetical protein
MFQNIQVELKTQMMLILIILIFTFISSLSFIINKEINILIRIACIGIFIIGFWLLFQRDIYLPFLSYTALPPTLLKDSFTPENSNIETNITIDAPNGTKVLYWGAKESSKIQKTPWAAYNDYSNAGITYVNNRHALLKFNCPSKYNVPFGYTLNRHIHYRITLPNGLLSPIYTIYVNC